MFFLLIIGKPKNKHITIIKKATSSSVYSDKSKLIEFLDKWNLNSFSDRVKFFITDDVPSDIISFIESRFKYFIKLVRRFGIWILFPYWFTLPT